MYLGNKIKTMSISSTVMIWVSEHEHVHLLGLQPKINMHRYNLENMEVRFICHLVAFFKISLSFIQPFVLISLYIHDDDIQVL